MDTLSFSSGMQVQHLLGSREARNHLTERYGEDQYTRWEKESSQHLSYLCFEMEHGFIVEDLEAAEAAQVPVEELESLDPVNFPPDEEDLFRPGFFNPLRYRLSRASRQRRYYRIGKTGKVLVLRSVEELRRYFTGSYLGSELTESRQLS